MRFVAALLLIIGALAAVGFARHEDRVRQQNELAVIASDLAGRKVGVRCPNFLSSLVETRAEGGRVRFNAAGNPADYTELSPDTCKALRRIGRFDYTCLARNDCGYAEFKGGWAAHTLAHEAFHLRGYQDEGVTECYALQNTAFVAERLGVVTEHAQALQAWLFEKGYPNMPQDYRSSQCYDGGPLDLRPEHATFP